jgi:hypothetical protein
MTDWQTTMDARPTGKLRFFTRKVNVGSSGVYHYERTLQQEVEDGWGNPFWRDVPLVSEADHASDQPGAAQ